MRTPGSDVDAPAFSLTPREAEAVLMLASYGDYRQAAFHMGIKGQTFKNNLTRAYAKLGVNGAIGAFRALGLLRVPRRGWRG